MGCNYSYMPWILYQSSKSAVGVNNYRRKNHTLWCYVDNVTYVRPNSLRVQFMLVLQVRGENEVSLRQPIWDTYCSQWAIEWKMWPTLDWNECLCTLKLYRYAIKIQLLSLYILLQQTENYWDTGQYSASFQLKGPGDCGQRPYTVIFR